MKRPISYNGRSANLRADAPSVPSTFSKRSIKSVNLGSHSCSVCGNDANSRRNARDAWLKKSQRLALSFTCNSCWRSRSKVCVKSPKMMMLRKEDMEEMAGVDWRIVFNQAGRKGNISRQKNVNPARYTRHLAHLHCSRQKNVNPPGTLGISHTCNILVSKEASLSVSRQFPFGPVESSARLSADGMKASTGMPTVEGSPRTEKEDAISWRAVRWLIR